MDLLCEVVSTLISDATCKLPLTLREKQWTREAQEIVRSDKYLIWEHVSRDVVLRRCEELGMVEPGEVTIEDMIASFWEYGRTYDYFEVEEMLVNELSIPLQNIRSIISTTDKYESALPRVRARAQELAEELSKDMGIGLGEMFTANGTRISMRCHIARILLRSTPLHHRHIVGIAGISASQSWGSRDAGQQIHSDSLIEVSRRWKQEIQGLL